ncbi:restriction endonuclease subunit R [Burkholderia sp. AU18528]|uniref:DEAD/DEAH box helicase n=1 Tax=Burkholderia sp. AU18528 TaxID=2015350 RepID=UPI000C0858B9|nr:DEAD/DEAH box helicase family protein [Burkholderia sp. AU18528]PHP86101.1 restriction endonuclease subunit R [Burkholderia sp. AU18528]
MDVDVDFYGKNEIYRSWADNRINFDLATEANEGRGFRPPQRAAVLAVLSHLDMEPTKPATVVMPTGTGKTDTIFALVLAGLFKRTLLVVPSDALRTQMSERLRSLQTLRTIGAVSDSVQSPAVHVAEGAERALDTAAIENANVTVATPATLATLDTNTLESVLALYTHIVFDEAHHVVAETWDRIRTGAEGRPMLYFTATPFRLDEQRLGSKIVFNYTLRQAQRDGYFQQIEFHHVREYRDELADEAIAEKALELLQKDLAEGFDHILMARCSSIAKAKTIAAIYERLSEGTELNPVLLHSRTGDRRETLNTVLERRSRVVICVNMLGEGFDLPQLKLAAIHDQHRSPAVTLQFIGRLTRVSSKLGPAKFVANIANQRIEGEMQGLYESDADWGMVIREVSENKIRREVERQEFEAKFEGNDDAEKIVALNPRPHTSAVAYRVDRSGWRRANVSMLRGRGESLELESVSDDERIVMAVTKESIPVDWARSASVMTTSWQLYLAYYRPSDRTLFATCTGDEIQLGRFVKLIAPSASRIRDEAVFRILSGIDLLKLQNVGLIRGGREVRFTMHVGHDVNTVMADLENGMSAKSNIFAVGHSEGERTSAGCSAKGKLWKMDSTAVDEWISWCDEVAVKINDENIDTTDILKNVLRSDRIKDAWPQGLFFADWPDQLFIDTETKCMVTVESESYAIADLVLGPPSIEAATTLAVPLIAAREGESERELLKIRIHLRGDSYSYSAPGARFTVGSRECALAEYLDRDRLRLLSVDGSIVIGNYRIYSPTSLNVRLPQELMRSWSWDGVDISRESMADRSDLASVQGYTFSKIEDDYDIIFDDDGAGEVADLVAVRVRQHWIEVDLYHCKYCKSGQMPGARVDDVYVVTGQASRSVKWHTRGPALFQRLLDRYSKSQSKGRDRILKGSPEEIDVLRKKARDMEVRLGFIVVQPAISAAGNLDEVLSVLGTSYLYIRSVANVNLLVIGSP